MTFIQPLWPAPATIIAGTTTREGGISQAPFNSFNLALHVNDDESNVAYNRKLLEEQLCTVAGQPAHTFRWHWLSQTHSNHCVDASKLETTTIAEADAIWSQQSGDVCTVMTADCLPVLLADRHGRAVAAIHAGWRGLCNGVIDNCVRQLCASATLSGETIHPVDLLAWLGPAIGPTQFEVGEDVWQAFQSSSFADSQTLPQIEQCFISQASRDGARYHCDLYQLATIALHTLDIKQVYGGGYCTHQQNQQFYSYRREGQTGRMASFIALLPG